MIPEGVWKITATAEVRDKDGNLKSQEPIEITVTEAQAKALTEGEKTWP